MTMIELDVIDDDKYNNKYIYDIKLNDAPFLVGHSGQMP